MVPELDQMMRGSFAMMVTQLLPQLGPGYQAGTLGTVGGLLFMGAAEADRAVEVRVAEDREMRALFAEAAGVVDDAALKAELEEAVAAPDPGLRVSALNEANAKAADLLIRLQAHLEGVSSAAASDLDGRIWAYLAAAASRRRLPHPAEAFG